MKFPATDGRPARNDKGPGGEGTVGEIRADALALTGPESPDPLLARIGDARNVLFGEASHGTAGYYRWRDLLTRRLIDEKGFSFVAVEGDWPDCHALHCSVTAAPGVPRDPVEVLEDFDRWPTWMWANTDVARFSHWLRRHNTGLPAEERVGFFGLDTYSLWESLQAVNDYLGEHDPEAVEHAVEAFRCFEPYAQDPRSYAMATQLVPSGCEPEVLALLVQLRRRAEQASLRGLRRRLRPVGRARPRHPGPARPGSLEELMHQALPGGAGLFVFPDRGRGGWLREERDHRAIGVVYRPEREKWGNYVSTVLGERYDAFCFLDRTTALTPLHTAPADTREEETWPTGV
jgi:erythromycin esterase-like protein